jgi:uncharacterized coiled-coil DUF342 family protein
MNTNEIDKIDRCRHLLPEPAPQVVGQLLEEIRAMRDAISEARAKLHYIVNEADALWDIRDEARAALTKLQPFLK